MRWLVLIANLVWYHLGDASLGIVVRARTETINREGLRAAMGMLMSEHQEFLWSIYDQPCTMRNAMEDPIRRINESLTWRECRKAIWRC